MMSLGAINAEVQSYYTRLLAKYPLIRPHWDGLPTATRMLAHLAYCACSDSYLGCEPERNATAVCRK